MIQLKYELKTEKFEENEETIETKIVEITAETNHPSTRIVFEKSSKPLAETLTNNEGIAVCGFTPQSRKCIVKATCNEETAQVTVPNLADLSDSNEENE